MRNIFRSTSFKVLIAVAVMLLAALTAGAVLKDGSSPVTSVVSTVFSPLSKACSSIADKFENFKGGFVSSKRYMEKQAELEQEIADYQSKLVDYERLKKQVAAYEKFLGVKEQHPDFSFAAGTVIGRDSADMFGSFQLSCGEKDGVSVGDPVISGEYLLGQVTEVGPSGPTGRLKNSRKYLFLAEYTADLNNYLNQHSRRWICISVTIHLKI